MNYDANANNSPEQHTQFVAELSSQTVSALKNAQNNPPALTVAIQEFLTKASAANLTAEEIEDILGVNEPSIMDLADLSDADEDVVIDTFENFLNQ